MKGLYATQLRDIKKGILPTWLYLSGQNSMKNSIELRSPFLDQRLFKYLNFYGIINTCPTTIIITMNMLIYF